MTRILTLVALTVALMASGAIAQEAKARVEPQGSATKAPVSDSLFVLAATEGGQAQVTLAEMGSTKSIDSELNKLSKELLDDHSKLNSDLMSLATQKSITLPGAIGRAHQFCVQSLAGLEGEDFDRHYAKAQLILHMESVDMFEAEAERGQDPGLKNLAATSLTRIKRHLKQIKAISMKYEKAEHKPAK